MNLHELGPSWRKQNDSQGRLSTDRLAGIIRRAEYARWRHWLMGALGFVLAILTVRDFGRKVMNDSNMLVQVGAGMVVLGALVLLVTIIRDLWLSRSTGESTCNYFSQELRRTERLIASSKSPLIYVLLVLMTIGAVLVAIGSGLPTPRMILAIAIVLAVWIGAFWGVRSTVRRAEQRRVDLEEVLAEFRDKASAT